MFEFVTSQMFFDCREKNVFFGASQQSIRLEHQTRLLIQEAPIERRRSVVEEFFCKISSETIVRIEISETHI
jgi:hypothetical protein